MRTLKHSQLEKSGWKQVGEASVDSGALMIVDPCYCKSFVDDPPDARRKPEETFTYNRACEITLKKPCAGQIDMTSLCASAVVSATTYGDGLYPIYIKYGDHGRPVAMMVVMEDEETAALFKKFSGRRKKKP